MGFWKIYVFAVFLFCAKVRTVYRIMWNHVKSCEIRCLIYVCRWVLADHGNGSAFVLKTYSVREKIDRWFCVHDKTVFNCVEVNDQTTAQTTTFIAEKMSFHIAIRFHVRWKYKLYASVSKYIYMYPYVSLCIFQTGVQRYKKIHLDTWYLNVSFRPGCKDTKRCI